MSEHTPGPWRISPWYAPTKGGYGIADTPTPNRYQAIVQPLENSEYGCKSFVVGVGVKGDVEDYWLSIKDADARLIARAPEMQAEIDRLRGLLGEWVSEAEQRPYVYRAHRSHQVCICLTCRTRKELEPTDGNT